MPGTLPMSDSPTPAIMILLRIDSVMTLLLRALELRDLRAFSATLLKSDFDGIADLNVECILADNIGHHARSLGEIDKRKGIGRLRLKFRERSAMNDGLKLCTVPRPDASTQLVFSEPHSVHR